MGGTRHQHNTSDGGRITQDGGLNLLARTLSMKAKSTNSFEQKSKNIQEGTTPDWSVSRQVNLKPQTRQVNLNPHSLNPKL